MVAEDHYPSLAQLTPHHREKIAELRKRAAEDLATYPEYDTEFSLLRWLMGWDYDIETILPKLKYAISILRNLGMNDQKTLEPAEINALIRSMSNAADYFPGGLMGTDDEGNIIYMQAIALAHPKSLVKSGAVSELFKLNIIETELAFKLVRQAEAKNGKKLGVKIIIDLDQFSMDLLYTPTLMIYKDLLTIMQATFPDFARKIFLINTPAVMKMVYAMISPVLSKQTREKVQFLGSDWKNVLAQELGAHNIYPHWGGNKPHSNPRGDLRCGGKTPEKMWYVSDKNPLEQGLTKVNVPARNKIEVKVQCEAGKELNWFWKVNSGDLDFSIQRNGKEVFPKFRLPTDSHPEFGKMPIKESGEYSLVFDNSHGTVWSKDVKYRTWQ